VPSAKKHMVRYLAEFEWRFNHRFDLAAMIPVLGHSAIRIPPATYAYLKWTMACNQEVF
jgi:hypothetical protein